jgi:dihydrofolate reductase
MNLPQTEQRKVISLMHVSLDGFTAGPNGELEWAIVDEEGYRDVADLLRTVDTALYGRVTYQMMESSWPTVLTDPASTKDELHHAHWVEKVHKIVFSRTLESVTWNNTRLVKENIAEEIAKLKQLPGKDLMIFGSPSIVHTLTQRGLIDEYRLSVNPVVLGGGIPLFKDIDDRIDLKLLEAKTFHSGVVGLHYRKEAGADER